MEKSNQCTKNLVIVNSDLIAADSIINRLDEVIQDTGNLELSKQLNEISDLYQMVRNMIKASEKVELSQESG